MLCAIVSRSQSSVSNQIEKYLKTTHVECLGIARISYSYHSSAEQNENSSIGHRERTQWARAHGLGHTVRIESDAENNREIVNKQNDYTKWKYHVVSTYYYYY